MSTLLSFDMAGLTPELVGEGLEFDVRRAMRLYPTSDRTGQVLHALWPEPLDASFEADILDEDDEEVGTVTFLSRALPAGDFTIRANGSAEGSDSGDSTITASIQPLSVKESEDYASITAGRKAVWLFTSLATDIRDAQSPNPDHFTHHGTDYEIAKVEAWDNSVRPHKRALCVSLTPLKAM